MGKIDANARPRKEFFGGGGERTLLDARQGNARNHQRQPLANHPFVASSCSNSCPNRSSTSTQDESGTIDYRELEHELRREARIAADEELKRKAKGLMHQTDVVFVCAGCEGAGTASNTLSGRDRAGPGCTCSAHLLLMAVAGAEKGAMLAERASPHAAGGLVALQAGMSGSEGVA